MPDDIRGNGIATRGQITHERVGGWAEIIIAIRDTLVLAAIAAIHVISVPVLMWLAGPPSLIVLVPLSIDYTARWFEPTCERMSRYSAAAWAAVVAIVLALVPDVALVWWPWRWQASRESWWGLWWPAFWPQAIPSAIIGRAVVVAIILKSLPETWFLVNRLRQQIVAPTLDGLTYTQADAHAVEIPGVVNPHRNPEAPQPETAKTEVTRAMFWRPKGSDGNGARIVDCPSDVATYDQLATIAELVLSGGVQPTRTQMTRRNVFTDPGWRTFQDWAVAQGLMVKTGEAASAPYVMTDDGSAWLTTIRYGDDA